MSADRRLRASTPGANAIVRFPSREAWRQIFAADAQAILSQSPEWIDALCALGSHHDASRLYETPGGNRILLPMVRRRGLWPSQLAPRSSMPIAWGIGGPIYERPPTHADLVAVVNDLATDPSVSIRIRPNALHADLWAAAAADSRTITVPGTVHVIDLTVGEDHLWTKGFKKESRREVRVAQKSGVTVESDTSGRLIPVFCELQRRSVERWATQQHEPLWLARWRADRRDSIEKLQQIATSLGDACKVWVASHDGRPAAAMIVLQGANAYDTRGAMDKEIAGPVHANALLQWLAIQDACRNGCADYHLGETSPGSSLARSKEKFGARPVAYASYRFERLPITRTDALVRRAIKRTLRFRDA